MVKVNQPQKPPEGAGGQRQAVSPDHEPAYPEVAEVGKAAAGRWQSILTALGLSADYLRNKHGPCPGCGGRDRFRFDDRDGRGTFVCGQGGGEPLAGDGFSLLQHVQGWTFPETVATVAKVLGMDARETPAPRPAPAAPAPEAAGTPEQNSNGEIRRKRKALRRVWRESRPILTATDALPVAWYLRGRGLRPVLGTMPDDLRHHPALPYWDTTNDEPVHVGDYPAMLAVVRGPGGQPVTLHRTYLTHDGQKAPVDAPRKLMPAPMDRATKGGAIRLYPAGPTLAVAEGIETALAVRLATGWPVWATVSAGGMQALELPAEVEELVVCADYDRAGLQAAEALARAVAKEGRHGRVAIPPEPGQDWADAIKGGANE